MADTEDVKDTETTESSPEVTEDVKEVSESSSDASAADQGSQSAESETPVPEDIPTRESLIEELTGKTKKPAKVVDDESETEAEEVVEAEGDKPEATAETDISDEELAAPLGKEGTRGARERIQSLLKQRNAYKTEIESLKGDAEFGRSIGAVASEAKMAPEQLAAWISLAAEVNTDPRTAPARLMAEAKRIAAATGVTLQREVETVVPKELDDIEEMLIADVLEGNVSADVVKRYREKIRAAKLGKATAPAAAPTPPPVPHAAPAQTPNADPKQDPAVQSGLQAIAKAQVEFKQKYPANWDAIQAAVHKRIGKYAGTAPAQWATLYRQEVDAYIRENATPVRKSPSTNNQPLRPTTTTTKTTAPKEGTAEYAKAVLTGRIK